MPIGGNPLDHTSGPNRVLSTATFAELEARLRKPKFDRYLSPEVRRAILHDANAAAHGVNTSEAIAGRVNLFNCLAENVYVQFAY